jgi:hypothetical protein
MTLCYDNGINAVDWIFAPLPPLSVDYSRRPEIYRMKSPNRLLLALLASVAMAWGAIADAQNCNNGNSLYHQAISGQPVSCAMSSCHGPDPKSDMNHITSGGQYAGPGDQAANIDQARQTVPDMQGNAAVQSLTQSDLSDIALYIWYREGNSPCPAAAPSFVASPTSLSFGNVNVGSTSASQSVTITNNGAAGANSLSRSASDAAEFVASGTCTTVSSLAVNASCTLTVQYQPAAAGADNQTWTMTSGSVSVTVNFSGTGVNPSAPNVSATPMSLSFGNVTVGQTSAAQTITVSNTGNAAATNMAYPAAPAKFNKSGTCSSATLNAGSSCTVVFSYSPTAAASDSATYTITGGGASISISLSGTGSAPAAPSLSAAPTSLTFGSVQVGSSSTAQSLTITNSGGAAATSVSLLSSDLVEFVVGANTCGTSLGAGTSCSLNVTFTPSATGAKNATLTVSYSGGPSVVVAMSGTGTAAPTPNLSAAPTSLGFGSITIGSTSAMQTVTLNNTGGGAATGIAFANSSGARFPVSGNTCGATLNAGTSCTFNVAYAPSAAGADNATLTISSTGAPNIVVSMSGTGTSAPSPSLSAAPPLVAFGNVTVGQTSPGTAITVTNAGTASATSVSLANSDSAEFLVSGNTCGTTIAASASCGLSVAYKPGSAGPGSATLTFTYAGGGSLSISLSGTGVSVSPPPGTGQLSMPAGVTMPDTSIGATSAASTVTISNIGSAAVTVSSITSSNAVEFAVGASTCASVAAGANCTFTVTFMPAASGARSASITVASNGSGSPQTIVASGNGLAGSLPPPPPNVVAAIEYHHAAFDHYFITTIPDEITKLDNGTFVGWARTGRQINVYQAAASGLKTVCRFFSTAFAPKSSHFYTPDAAECATVKTNPNWTFEGEVFYTVSPAQDGTCPTGLNPVYRVYNNGQGAAPNHRYTTDLALRATMLAQGWIPEGYGTIGVIMCAP